MRALSAAVALLACAAGAAEVHPAFARPALPAALDGLSVYNGDAMMGAFAFSAGRVTVSAAQQSQGSAPVEVSGGGVRATVAMSSGSTYRLQWRDLVMTPDTRFLFFTDGKTRVPLRCVKGSCEPAQRPFVGLSPGHQDRRLFEQGLATIRARDELAAELFEAPAPKNAREVTEIWFDPDAYDAEPVARRVALALRATHGFLTPKKWTFGTTPYAVQVFFGAKDAGRGPRVSPVLATVKPDAQAIAAFLASHDVPFSSAGQFFRCKGAAALAATCTSTTSTPFTVPTRYSVEGTGFSFPLAGGPFKGNAAVKLAVELLGPELMVVRNEKGRALGIRCLGDAACTEVDGYPVAVRSAPDDPRLAMLEDSSGAAGTFVLAGPPPDDVKAPVLRFARYQHDSAAAIERRLVPFTGPLNVAEGELPFPYQLELVLPRRE